MASKSSSWSRISISRRPTVSPGKPAVRSSFSCPRWAVKKRSPTISSCLTTTWPSSSRLSIPFSDANVPLNLEKAVRSRFEGDEIAMLEFLLPAFVASLILTGIHAYLGVHVVERGVIFVDLALAQIAALGATMAILIGMDPHGTASYWMSLGFTFIGALIFSFVRSKQKRIPLEAFIGITYAVASAAAIIAMSKATGETEHLKDMLVGNILAVSKHDVIKTAILYGCVGLFHFVFRKKFLAISLNHNHAEESGINVKLWDFL